MGQQILVTGRGLVESVRSVGDAVWFADWFARQIIRVDADGVESVVARLPGMPICFDWLPDGDLVTTGSAGALQRLPLDAGPPSEIALDALSGKPFNDIVVDPRGNIFVNNVGFEFPGGEFAPGFVAVVTPDGTARRVADDLAFPNGMAVTPDGSTLIVAESYAARLTAFQVADDGALSDRRVWADLGEGVAPDGISLDSTGAVWYASVPQQHCARVAEGGEVLDLVTVDRGCFDCAIAESDTSRTLYIAAAAWDGDLAGSGQIIAVEL